MNAVATEDAIDADVSELALLRSVRAAEQWRPTNWEPVILDSWRRVYATMIDVLQHGCDDRDEAHRLAGLAAEEVTDAVLCEVKSRVGTVDWNHVFGEHVVELRINLARELDAVAQAKWPAFEPWPSVDFDAPEWIAARVAEMKRSRLRNVSIDWLTKLAFAANGPESAFSAVLSPAEVALGGSHGGEILRMRLMEAHEDALEQRGVFE